MQTSKCSSFCATAIIAATSFMLVAVGGNSLAKSNDVSTSAPIRYISIDTVSSRNLNQLTFARCTPELEMLPIHLSLSLSVLIGGQSAELGVTVNSVPAGGGYVQILCSSPNVLITPSGCWPYQVVYPAGSPVTQSFTVTANNVLLPELVTIYIAAADADPNDLSQWTEAGTVLVAPSL